jgi:hypothetical protein
MMHDYVNTPLRLHFANLRLSPGEVRGFPPKAWPSLGQSQFRRFIGAWPRSPAILHGDLCQADGERLRAPGQDGAGIPEAAKTAVFRTRAPARKLPGIQIYNRFLIMSEPALSIWLEHDADALDHARLDFQFKGGEQASPPMHLVDVTRFVDAVDFDRTYLNLAGQTGGGFALHDWGPIGIRDDIPRGTHVFRENSFPAEIYVSTTLVDALTKAKIKGWQAKDPADHYRMTEHLKKVE